MSLISIVATVLSTVATGSTDVVNIVGIALFCCFVQDTDTYYNHERSFRAKEQTRHGRREGGMIANVSISISNKDLQRNIDIRR